jgi:hypothetical protein
MSDRKSRKINHHVGNLSSLLSNKFEGLFRTHDEGSMEFDFRQAQIKLLPNGFAVLELFARANRSPFTRSTAGKGLRPRFSMPKTSSRGRSGCSATQLDQMLLYLGSRNLPVQTSP